MTDSADTNLITMLQRFEGVQSDAAAIIRVRQAISQREAQLLDACESVLADPMLANEPAVRKWILALPYLTSGNCCKSAVFMTLILSDKSTLVIPLGWSQHVRI